MELLNHLNNSATIAELTDLSGNVAKAIDSAALTDVYLNNQNQELKTFNAQLLKGMAAERGKALKEQVDAADILRDDLTMALINFLDGFIKWNKPVTAPAAILLRGVIDTQGPGITRLSLEKESASLEAILTAFEKPEMLKALADTNLTALAAELRDAQKAFTVVYQESAAQESVKAGEVVPSDIRRVARDKVNSMMDYMASMAKANPAVYSALSAKLVELVSQLNQKIRVRKSSTKTAATVTTATT